MNSTIREKSAADVTLTFRNADQTPIIAQEITLAQTKHKFLFGVSGFDLIPLSNNEYSGKEKEQAEERASHLLALFNAVTLPFYWARFEPLRGKPLTGQLIQASQWCVDHHLTVKGHPLCWHTLTADWLLSLSNTEILQEQTKRIRREVSDFRGLIGLWDVINEAVIMPIFDKYDNGITRLCKELGRIKTIKAMFDAAREENPGAILVLNDFDVSPAYDILIEGCLEAGIKIDVIGIQSHMHQGYWGREKTLKILDQFSRFNLPIHFSETTLVSGRLMPPEIVDLNDYQVEDWPTTPEGEERQAREAIQHYKTLFAHPLVEGITWWDLADGGWINAPGGLIRKDGSTKLAYNELLKLVKGEWWVSPTKLTTDSEGQIQFSGYLGEYEVTLGKERRQLNLNEAGASRQQVYF
ncbi:MAG: endo-1,4-beta-xylanase [Chloroflexi bacterium]|nr:endo-1,4-beta-xylanase [Chloroflexota bacterium]